MGGCVRDLLLGHQPKDFDVATNATPEEIHKQFRGSRIIGRRFRLVHVRKGREIIEVIDELVEIDGCSKAREDGKNRNGISCAKKSEKERLI